MRARVCVYLINPSSARPAAQQVDLNDTDVTFDHLPADCILTSEDTSEEGGEGGGAKGESEEGGEEAGEERSEEDELSGAYSPTVLTRQRTLGRAALLERMGVAPEQAMRAAQLAALVFLTLFISIVVLVIFIFLAFLLTNLFTVLIDVFIISTVLCSLVLLLLLDLLSLHAEAISNMTGTAHRDLHEGGAQQRAEPSRLEGLRSKAPLCNARAGLPTIPAAVRDGQISFGSCRPSSPHPWQAPRVLHPPALEVGKHLAITRLLCLRSFTLLRINALGLVVVATHPRAQLCSVRATCLCVRLVRLVDCKL